MTADRFATALAAIDALHEADPARIADESGREVAAELLYARRMTAALGRLSEAPSEALSLAVRAQHLQRWRIPRDTYPKTKPGYHRWRTELKALHGQLARQAVLGAGYDDTFADRVESLVLKKRLKSDPEAQHLEDAACLVFLEHGLEAFAAEHDRGEVVRILRKTWAKMGDAGRREAGRLILPPDAQAMVTEAVTGEPGSA